MEILSEKVTKRIPFLKEIRIGDPLQGYPRSGACTIDDFESSAVILKMCLQKVLLFSMKYALPQSTRFPYCVVWLKLWIF